MQNGGWELQISEVRLQNERSFFRVRRVTATASPPINQGGWCPRMLARSSTLWCIFLSQ